jgi:hypothetical protein
VLPFVSAETKKKKRKENIERERKQRRCKEEDPIPHSVPHNPSNQDF